MNDEQDAIRIATPEETHLLLTLQADLAELNAYGPHGDVEGRINATRTRLEALGIPREDQP